ncbi:MAG: AAA family ATPase [Eubacterium sp.]
MSTGKNDEIKSKATTEIGEVNKASPKAKRNPKAEVEKVLPGFHMLPKAVKNNILGQMSSAETFDKYKSAEHISDMKLLKLKYKLCKNTYPPKTQSRIEALLAGCEGSDSGKLLNYIMNINTAYTPEKVSADEMVKQLDKVVYGHDAAKREIAMAVSSAIRSGKGVRLLLIGPNGTAKTRLIQAIGNARKKPLHIINLSNISSILDLAGCDKTYSESAPGTLWDGFYSLGSTDITLGLDEIDCTVHSNNKDGDPDSVLSEMLSCQAFTDKYLDAQFSVRSTWIIAAAVDESKISPKILNRFQKIYINDYSKEDQFVIAKSYMLPELYEEYSFDASEVFDDSTIKYVVENYGIKSGCSDIEAYLRKLLTKAVDECRVVPFSFEEIDTILDRENLMNDPIAVYRFHKDAFSKTDQKIIEKSISTINSPDKHDGSMEVAQTKLQYIADIYKNTVTPPPFDYNSFIDKVKSKISGRDELISAFARMMNYHERTGKIKNILLVGPPGTGKTSTLTVMSNAVGWRFNKISLNGVSKSDFLKGTGSFVHWGCPSEITKSLSVMGDTCVLILDEIDKIDRTQDNSVASALLDFLDSKIFMDNYLGVHINCNRVLVVATANNQAAIAPELLDRFEVIRIDGYTKSEKKKIFKEIMLPRMLKEYRVSAEDYAFTDEAVDFLISNYSSTAGARELDTFAQKIIGEVTMKNSHYEIGIDDIREIIGKPPIVRQKGITNKPGIVNGLSVNSCGLGSLFEIQTVISKTDKVLGMAQECLKESHDIAHTVAGMINSDCEDHCYTTLYGDGYTKKDGPSAGVATVVSIISAEAGIAVPSSYAFTGEISLMGTVHAVGGVEAKLEAAQEAGCKTAFIPQENYDYMGKETFDKFSLKVVPVSHINQVIDQLFTSKETTKIKGLAV